MGAADIEVTDLWQGYSDRVRKNFKFIGVVKQGSSKEVLPPDKMFSRTEVHGS